MKIILLIAGILFTTHSFGQNDTATRGFEVLAEKTGDLDKDGIAEKVIVYNTTDTAEDGIVRELRILKKNGTEWKTWKRSRNAVLKSEEGGMMGNPFEGIDISNGILIIHFSGGSNWKWFYTDKYRFQHNEFELIGHSNTYGKPCEYWTYVDFNLSTGKVIYKKEFEDCKKGQKIYKTQKESFYKKGISVNIGNRNLEDIKIISPKYKEEIYL